MWSLFTSSPSGPSPDDDSTRRHVVFMIHGYGGTSYDFKNLVTRLEKEHPNMGFLFHRAIANSSYAKTFDGVDPGVARLEAELLELVERHPKLESISIVGHSLGGIYARRLVKRLDDANLFERLQPKFFCTLATPHLGCRRPQTSLFNRLFHVVAGSICATTKELCLVDDDETPLLFEMTDDLHVLALSKFERLILYANVYNDFQVPYCTASISPINPYRRRNRRASEDGYATPDERSDDEDNAHETLGDELEGSTGSWLAQSLRNPLYPSSATCTEEFPHITAFSIENARFGDYVAKHAFASSDPKRRSHLRAMISRLNALRWERYDCVFHTVFAHEQIVNKRAFMKGADVARHFSKFVVGRGTVPGASSAL